MINYLETLNKEKNNIQNIPKRKIPLNTKLIIIKNENNFTSNNISKHSTQKIFNAKLYLCTQWILFVIYKLRILISQIYLKVIISKCIEMSQYFKYCN